MTPGAARADAPVFVVGSPRSGTTWLYHLLLSAGGFAVYNAEASVFNLLAPRFGDLSIARNREGLLEAWLPSEFFRRSGLEPQRFSAAVRERCRSAGDFLRLLMEGIAIQQGVRRWAECTPENLLHVRAIKAAIPDALFLHIVRDGRDVACSLAEQGWIGHRLPPHHPGRVLRAGLYWDWMVRRGRDALAEVPNDALEVRFEQLVESPADTLQAIGAFACHDLDYQVIRDHAIGSVRHPNTSFRETGQGFHPVGRWREKLDAAQLARLEAAIGDLLQVLGYPLGSDRRARGRARAAAARRLSHGYFSGRHFLKTRTPLGQVFTDATLLRDFRAFDRDRLMPATRKPA